MCKNKLIVTLLLGIVCLVGLANPGFAESDKGLLSTGGGGAFTELIKVDVTELNGILHEGGFAPFNDWMVTYGGGLFSQTENNFRYSNFYAQGQLTSAVNAEGKKARLSLSHGGIWLDQLIPLVPELGVSAGGALSLGGMKMELTHQQVSNFQDAVIQPQQTVMTVPFFMLKPEVGLHYSVKKYVDFELKLGYYYSHILGKWKQGGQRIEQGVQPLKQSHGTSVMLHLNFGF